MSPEYVLDPCWNCGTSRIAARFGGETLLLGTHPVLKTRIHVWVCLFVCNNCNKGTIVELQSDNINARPSYCESDPRNQGFEGRSEYPKRTRTSAPTGVPQKIRRWFEESVDIMATSPSASVGMFRKTLEATLNHIDKQSSGTRLSDRITRLCSNNKLTPEMGEWAQAIRTIAGDGLHSNNEPTPEQVEQTRYFTDALLQYVFTLPAFIKEHNKEQSQKNQGKRSRDSP